VTFLFLAAFRSRLNLSRVFLSQGYYKSISILQCAFADLKKTYPEAEGNDFYGSEDKA
jgi:hypothetical protein